MADAEDAYSATMSRTILVEKRARRLAEDDALRLYNRVRQLQKEEDKARKRIQDTKRRAREIIKLRERNEQRLAEKEARLREIEAELERQRIENLNKKEEALKARTEQENRLYAEKVTLVQQTKEEKLEIERLLAESKLLARKEALEQKEAIRRAQEEAKRKIDTVKASKLQMAQEEYERRLREEMEAKEQKEKEIEKLALLEVELIERLKLKQTQQKKAYQQLEAVLAMGVRRPSSKPSSPQVSVTALPGVASAGSAGGGGMDVVAAPTGADEEPSEEDVARAFSMYDEDGVGEISTLALDALMKDLGVPLSAQQLGQAIAQLDTQQQGKITFGEFLLWWKG